MLRRSSCDNAFNHSRTGSFPERVRKNAAGRRFAFTYAPKLVRPSMRHKPAYKSAFSAIDQAYSAMGATSAPSSFARSLEALPCWERA